MAIAIRVFESGLSLVAGTGWLLALPVGMTVVPGIRP
jgi:hypothetical protein